MDNNLNYQPNFQMPELPKEAKEKLEAMKSKLDKFSKIITKEHKEIMGVELLPPSRLNPEEKLPEAELEKLKQRINVLVVIDDTDVKKMTRVELKDRLMAIIQGMGREASQITGVKKLFHIQTYILTDF